MAEETGTGQSTQPTVRRVSGEANRKIPRSYVGGLDWLICWIRPDFHPLCEGHPGDSATDSGLQWGRQPLQPAECHRL